VHRPFVHRPFVHRPFVHRPLANMHVCTLCRKASQSVAKRRKASPFNRGFRPAACKRRCASKQFVSERERERERERDRKMERKKRGKDKKRRRKKSIDRVSLHTRRCMRAMTTCWRGARIDSVENDGHEPWSQCDSMFNTFCAFFFFRWRFSFACVSIDANGENPSVVDQLFFTCSRLLESVCLRCGPKLNV